MMADVLALARVQCHDGAVLVVFCDWRQIPLLTDAVQWAGWQWRGNAGLGQTDQPPAERTIPPAGGVRRLGEQRQAAD